MRAELKNLNLEMWKILHDPRATRLERLEAARIVASVLGVLVPSGIGEAALSQKQIVQLRAARQAIADRLFKKKEQKRLQNRRSYLRRQIAKAEAAQQPQGAGLSHTPNDKSIEQTQGEHGQIN